MKTYEQKSCPSCGQSVAKIATFCHVCGRIFLKKCEVCGEGHGEDEKFCPVLMEEIEKEFEKERWLTKFTRENMNMLVGAMFWLFLLEFMYLHTAYDWFFVVSLLILFASFCFFAVVRDKRICREQEGKRSALYDEKVNHILLRKEKTRVMLSPIE